MSVPAPTNDAALKVVLSDLHLGDGDPASENWVGPQQTAWERLLTMLAGTWDVELIINGDCFDFLVTTPPLDDRDDTDPAVGLTKMDHIIAAHPAWFAALGAFLGAPGHRVTFLIGNHDLELAFPAVRARARAALAAPAGVVRFCLARAYRPLPDVEIEHGCQFDPWNRVPALWDSSAQATFATPADLEAIDTDDAHGPSRLALPFGSRYYYRVYTPVQRRLPYFDAFVPSLPQAGVLATLCLYAPDLVIAGSRRSRALHEVPPPSAPSVAELERAASAGPAALFDAILPDIAALQAQVWRQAGIPLDGAHAETDTAYIAAVREGLAGDEQTALRAICAFPGRDTPGLPDLDAAAAATMLARDPVLRLGLCGHTHQEGFYAVAHASAPKAAFVNTGTWFTRLALPAPDDIGRATMGWLRAPHAAPSPLPPATAFTYAVLSAHPSAVNTSATLLAG